MTLCVFKALQRDTGPSKDIKDLSKGGCGMKILLSPILGGGIV